MKADDRVSGTVLMGLAVATCVGSIQLRIGSFKAPGPGFFPLLMGLLIGIFSLILFLRGVSNRSKSQQSSESLSSVLGRRKIWYILLSLIAYGFLLDLLGFLFTTFLIFAFILRSVEPQRWWICIVGGLAASSSSYALFYLALGVQLPRGLLIP